MEDAGQELESSGGTEAWTGPLPPHPFPGPGQSNCSDWVRLGPQRDVMFGSSTLPPLQHWVFSLPCSGEEKPSFCLYYPAIQS